MEKGEVLLLDDSDIPDEIDDVILLRKPLLSLGKVGDRLEALAAEGLKRLVFKLDLVSDASESSFGRVSVFSLLSAPRLSSLGVVPLSSIYVMVKVGKIEFRCSTG